MIAAIIVHYNLHASSINMIAVVIILNYLQASAKPCMILLLWVILVIAILHCSALCPEENT